MARSNMSAPVVERSQRRVGRPPSLSRDQIARAALALVDRHGLAALSMRRLAAELGVGTMSLYRHFRDKDALIDAVVDVASREAESELEVSGSWQERIAGLMLALRRNLARHPSLVQIRLARPMLTPAALRLTEGSMRILTEAGFARPAAAHGYRTLFLYTFACSSFDAGRDPQQLTRAAASALTAVPPDDYPAVSGAVSELAATMDADAQFRRGLETIIEGLEAQLRPAQAPKA